MNRRALLIGTGAALTGTITGHVVAANQEQTDDNGANGEEIETVIGDLVEGENLHLVIENLETTSEIDEFTQADAGNEFLVVRLAYKNVSDEFQSVSGWLQTRVHDDEDYSYDQSLYGTGEALDGGEIAPGEVERGDVVYEVPEDATGLSLEFDFERGLFGSLDRAAIDLERESDDPVVLEQDLEIDVHGISDSVEQDGTTVTVNEIDTAVEFDQFTQASEGYEYVIVDITVANDTGEEQSVSTVLQMQLKDEHGFSYGEDLGAFTALDRAFDEGSPLADGDQRRGQLAYEVEDGIEPLYWVFEFSLFNEGDKTFWQLR